VDSDTPRLLAMDDATAEMVRAGLRATRISAILAVAVPNTEHFFEVWIHGRQHGACAHLHLAQIRAKRMREGRTG
jgi:hypothetical protein